MGSLNQSELALKRQVGVLQFRIGGTTCVNECATWAVKYEDFCDVCRDEIDRDLDTWERERRNG